MSVDERPTMNIPTRRAQAEHAGENAEHLARIHDLLATIADGMAAAPKNCVLETAIAIIDADGTKQRGRYRIPFAAVMVINPSSAQITVAAGPRQGQAPGAGAGAFIVPPKSWAVMPLVDTEVTFYGTAGVTFSYSVTTAMVSPAAGALGALAGDTSAGTAAVGAGATVALAAPNTNRDSLLVVNTGAVTVTVGYDPTGANNLIPVTAGNAVTFRGGKQLYATNSTGAAGAIAYIAD